MKMCSRCGYLKETTQFNIDKRYQKPRSYCKSCQDNYNIHWKKNNPEKVKESNLKSQLKWKLKNVYKCSPEEYEQAAQNAKGICPICHKDTKLYIDHDHEIGRFRGLVCSNCNMLLGMAYDDPQILERAIQYLQTWAIS